MKAPLLITAFGPFKGFPINPSEMLLERLNYTGTCRVIEVSFQAVNEFVRDELKGRGRILMLGVASNSKSIRVERFARNQVCGLADARGKTMPPGKIHPTAPMMISGKLFSGWPNRDNIGLPLVRQVAIFAITCIIKFSSRNRIGKRDLFTYHRSK